MLSKYNFGFNKKTTIKFQWYVLIDNFEQLFENCVLITQNTYKSVPDQTNSFNTSNNELIKIFRGFQVFEYALWQTLKTQKCRKSTENFLNQKNTQC